MVGLSVATKKEAGNDEIFGGGNTAGIFFMNLLKESLLVAFYFHCF